MTTPGAVTGSGGRSRYDDLQALLLAEPPSRPGTTGMLERVCVCVVPRVSVTGAAVDLMSPDASQGVAAASDARSHRRAELQYATGEGPCHDAFTDRRPVLVPDLSRALGRWPGYATAALEAGTQAVFAFPLLVGAAGFGVLELVRDEAGSLDEEQVADALTFAQLTTDHLVESRLTTTEGDLSPDLASAVDYRNEIYQAQGMLTVSLGVTLAEALVLMRSFAFSHDVPLLQVAEDVRRGSRLTDADDGGPTRA